MVLTFEEWCELQELKEQELAVWSQLSKWAVDRCNTYDNYYKGDNNGTWKGEHQCQTPSQEGNQVA